MENTSPRAMEVLKILDSISSVSRNALISRWNKARGVESEKPSDVDEDEDELVELELSEINKKT